MRLNCWKHIWNRSKGAWFLNSKKYKDVLYKMRYINDLRDMIHSSAELYGEDPAFLVKDVPGGKYRPVSYNQLKEDIDALGTKFVEMGLKDKKVAIIGENSYEWVVTYLAVTNGTGVVVPLDKDLTEVEIGNLIGRSGIEAIVFSGKMREKTMAALEGFDDIRIRININAVSGEDGDISWKELLSEGRQLLENGNRDFVDAVIDR